MAQLAPCPECKRHARVSDPVCPFCGSRASRAPVAPRGTARLTRAAVFFAGAVSLAGCEEPASGVLYGGAPPPPAVTEVDTPADPAPPPEAPPPPIAPEPVVVQPVEVQPAEVQPADVAPPDERRAQPPPEPPSSPVAAYGGPPMAPGPGADPQSPF